MKIILIIADITRTGGTERATVNLANMLCQNHEVKILSLSDENISFFELNDNVIIDALGLKEIPKVFISLFR